MIFKAAQFAAHAHAGQTRKFTGRPYIEHPMRVAGRVTMLPCATEEMVAAAWLHDVIEDCYITYDHLESVFDPTVASRVLELTNPSIKHKHLHRKQRKQIDRDHFRTVSKEAKIIKLLDRIDNVRDMSGAEDGFKRVYLDETLMLGTVLLEIDDDIKPLYIELITELKSLL